MNVGRDLEDSAKELLFELAATCRSLVRNAPRGNKGAQKAGKAFAAEGDNILYTTQRSLDQLNVMTVELTNRIKAAENVVKNISRANAVMDTTLSHAKVDRSSSNS